MSGGPLLEVEGLVVRYGAVPAVRNLACDVGEGVFVGLLGPNGAGKTTTLLAIMGGLPVASGDLRLAGRSLRGRAPEEIARSGVALVPERRLVEQRAQRTIGFADCTYLVANGELRLVLDPEDAADTDRLVAAYLS